MPNTTAERPDDLRSVCKDLRSLRKDLQDVRLTLERMDEKLGGLMRSKADRATSVKLAAAQDRLAMFLWLEKSLGSFCAVAAVAGAFSIAHRLSSVEPQVRSVGTQLSEIKVLLNRRAEVPGDLEARINRSVRAAVDEALNRAALPKSSPGPNP